MTTHPIDFGPERQLASLEREERLARTTQDYARLAEISKLRALYAAHRHVGNFETLCGRSGDYSFPFPISPSLPRSSRKVPQAVAGIPHGTIEGYLTHGCECWRCKLTKRVLEGAKKGAA